MSSRRLALAMSRERLLVRSGNLRERVADQSSAMAPALMLGDRVRDTVRWLRHHPAVLVSAFAVVVVVRPRIAFRWSVRAWSAWQLVRGWRRRLEALALV